MIRLTLTGKIIYGLLNQTVRLLLLMLAVTLLAEMQTAGIPTVLSDMAIPFDALRVRLMDALILTGFFAGGVMLCAETINAQHLLWVSRVWIVIIIAGVIVSPAVLSIGVIAFLILTYRQPTHSRFLTTWQIGMVQVAIALPLQAVSSQAVFAGLYLTHVAYGITAVGLSFWLMTRWSNVRTEWVQTGIANVAGVVTLAGLLISTSQLRVSPIYGTVAGFVILPCYMLLAGHHYRALRDRTRDMSLSPHWIAMATIFWLGVGVIGIITSRAGIRDIMQETRLAEGQRELVRWVMIMISLGLVNYIARDLRGGNRRVTGYIPLWLIGFGVGLAVIIGLCGGVVELYLREFVQLDSVTTIGLLLPLSIAQIVCWLGVTAGGIIYALGYVARRPTIITDKSINRKS